MTAIDAGAADARLVAALLAADVIGIGGAVLIGSVEAREAWLDRLRAALGPDRAPRRLATSVDLAALAGGIDLGTSLARGAPVHRAGILDQRPAPTLILSAPDRLRPEIVAALSAALDADDHAPRLVVTLDHAEALADVPAALADRLALRVTPPDRDPTPPAIGRAIPPSAPASARVVALLVRVAERLGISSLRPALQAVAVARACAALAGHRRIGDDELALAVRLVLAPRATRRPSAAPTPGPPAATPDQPPPGSTAPQTPSDGERRPSAPGSTDPAALDAESDLLVAAAGGALPADLLDGVSGRSRAGDGRRAGPDARAEAARGRRIGAFAMGRDRRRRLDLAATLAAAIPWQRLRGATPAATAPTRLAIRAEDLRAIRFRAEPGTTVVMAVDASGSSATQRLGEAKGALRTLLATCYVRRDQVAMIAFRRDDARLLLPPTRSPARAGRLLVALAAGGATPLAAGLLLATRVIDGAHRSGRRTVLLLLTDGGANVALDGRHDRAAATADALAAARNLRATGVDGVLVDIAPRPRQAARDLAREMGARHQPMAAPTARGLSGLATAIARRARR